MVYLCPYVSPHVYCCWSLWLMTYYLFLVHCWSKSALSVPHSHLGFFIEALFSSCYRYIRYSCIEIAHNCTWFVLLRTVHGVLQHVIKFLPFLCRLAVLWGIQDHYVNFLMPISIFVASIPSEMYLHSSMHLLHFLFINSLHLLFSFSIVQSTVN